MAASQEDAASTLGIDVRTFSRWLKRGCPGSPRRYVLSECIKWAREHAWSTDAVLIERARAAGDSGSIEAEYLRSRIEKISLDNQLTHRKIAKTDHRLVDADRVQVLLLQQADAIRNGLAKLEREFGSAALDLVLELIQEAESIDFSSAKE